MLSKAKIKWIKSLGERKFRQELQLFVAEGFKLVGELLRVQRPHYVVATAEWAVANAERLRGVEVDVVVPADLQRASFLRAPQGVLAVFPIPRVSVSPTLADGELLLALDGVQDPGNMGTIVRIAGWFGVRHIVCSLDTADVYNPKAVQATMGSLARVQVHYTDLPTFLSACHAPIYGTFLDGDNIYGEALTQHGVLVMGNEGKGISDAVASRVGHRLFVPPYPEGSQPTDSLNVAMATGIICAEFRRRAKQ
ncbi:MAG: RNA methyltransferase [Bacteroidaceae bacterium]|nr:RNA methyltransferase [Bacteroidaceae bacterium]